MVVLGDDNEPRLPAAEPFEATNRDTDEQAFQQGEAAHALSVLPASQKIVPTSVETAEAPQRRAQAAKLVRIDHRTELQNKDLSEWNSNYLENMREIARIKENNRSTAQAKKNAAFWILGQGIGGVQVDFGEEHVPHPLTVFSGQTLLDALIGPQPNSPSSKRPRSLSPDAESERHVRARIEDGDEVARDVPEDIVVIGFDDEGIVVQNDEYDFVSSAPEV